ncbi:MAG: hypothetical protein WCP73_02045 [Eubacteriales bacterium]
MFEPREIPKEILINGIIDSLDHLYAEDIYLISNKPFTHKENQSEQGLIFRFGIYLQDYIRKETFLNGYHLDLEYNRVADAKKTQSSFKNGTYPDLIIHTRGNNDCNLLVIECTTWWDSDVYLKQQDILRIKELTQQSSKYHFALGAYIAFEKNRSIQKWFINGKEINSI